MDYSLFPTFRARLKARAKVRQRRKEIVDLLVELETDFKAYLRIFNKTKNFSNEDWRKLIREPERRKKLLETLELSSTRFHTQANEFESHRRN